MKRKNLKAYVRLDKSGHPIAGSMIYRDKKPYGKFKPLLDPYGDVCCPPTPTVVDCAKLGTWSSATDAVAPVLAVYGRVSLSDSNCNVYRYGYLVDASPTFYSYAFLEKLDAAGNVIWQEYFNYLSEGQEISKDFVSMAIGPDDFVYLLGKNFIIKIAPDASVVWERSFTNASIFDVFRGVQVTPLNRLYILKDENLTSPFTRNVSTIYELNIADGSEVNSKTFSFTSSLSSEADVYNNYAFGSDKEGNILFPQSAYPGALQKEITALFKCDPNLNVLWGQAFDPFNSNWTAPYVTSEITDIQTDLNNNIVLSMPFTPVVLKMASDGSSIFWQHQMGSVANPNQGDNGRIANCPVDSEGNVFSIGPLSQVPLTLGNPTDRIDVIIKWKTDGTLDFVTGFYTNSSPFAYDFWQYTPSGLFSEAKNNALLITPSGEVPSITFKLPTATPVVSGIYGNVTFVDAFSYLQLGSLDFSLKSVTSVEYPAIPLVDNDWTFSSVTVAYPTTLVPII